MCKNSYQHLGYLVQHERAHSPRDVPIASLSEASYITRNGKFHCWLCKNGNDYGKKHHYVRHLENQHLTPAPDEAYHAWLWQCAMAKKEVGTTYYLEQEKAKGENVETEPSVSNEGDQIVTQEDIENAEIILENVFTESGDGTRQDESIQSTNTIFVCVRSDKMNSHVANILDQEGNMMENHLVNHNPTPTTYTAKASSELDQDGKAIGHPQINQTAEPNSTAKKCVKRRSCRKRTPRKFEDYEDFEDDADDENNSKKRPKYSETGETQS